MGERAEGGTTEREEGEIRIRIRIRIRSRSRSRSKSEVGKGRWWTPNRPDLSPGLTYVGAYGLEAHATRVHTYGPEAHGARGLALCGGGAGFLTLGLGWEAVEADL